MSLLEIKDLCCEVEGLEILKGVNLTIEDNEIVALLGPNGHGKSTLLNVIMGDPTYKVTKGQIIFKGQDITNLECDERSRLGVFASFQSPPSIQGVLSMDFFKMALNAHREKPVKLVEFYKALNDAYQAVDMDISYSERNLNDGFSGGERKRNEILQMNLLKPKLAILDEIDSGLDVDALDVVANNITKLHEENQTSFIIISHYSKLYQIVKPTKTVVIVDGKVAVSGDGQLALDVATKGYSYLKSKYGVSIKKSKKKDNVILENCAVKVTS